MRTLGPRSVILGVDDDPGIHDTFQLIFEDDYEVLSALSGAEAIAALTARPVDVVLLDILMPEMGGLAVLECTRRIRPDAHVIVVSVVDQARTALAAIRLGAVDYVTKPFDPDELTLIVRRALAGPVSCTSGLPTETEAIHRILVISGDVGVRASLAMALINGCHVETAGTLAGAMATLARSAPDVVVLDEPFVAADTDRAIAALRPQYSLGPVLVMTAEPACPGTIVGARRRGDVRRDFDRLFQELGELLTAKRKVPAMRRPSRTIARVVACVSRHYRDLTIEMLAQAVCLSPSHLCHKFVEETTMTPREYLTRVRIQAAKYLLRETTEKTETIAAMVGLYDAPHLSRMFRRHGENTPSAYRQT